MVRVFREPQSLWKMVQAQKCLPKLRVLAPRETRATESGHKATLTKSPRASTKGPYDEVHDGERAPELVPGANQGEAGWGTSPMLHPPTHPISQLTPASLYPKSSGWGAKKQCSFPVCTGLQV